MEKHYLKCMTVCAKYNIYNRYKVHSASCLVQSGLEVRIAGKPENADLNVYYYD